MERDMKNRKFFNMEQDGRAIKGSYEVLNVKENLNVLVVSPEAEALDSREFLDRTLHLEAGAGSDEREYVVKKYISDLLRYIRENKRPVDPENKKIIDFWEEYTRAFIPDEGLELSEKGEELSLVLMTKRALLLDVLEHRHKRTGILLDDKLSPSVLACESEEINALLNEMVTQLNNRHGSKRIAVIQPGQGYLIDYMIRYLENIGLLTIFDTSLLALDELKKKYEGQADRFSYRFYQDEYIEEDMIGAYDFIVSVNSIHQFDDAGRVLKNMRLMLKKEGSIHLIDFNQMDAISFLTAIFFQEKYLGIKNGARNEFFYRLDYLRDTAAHLYENKEVMMPDNEKAFYMKAENPIDFLKLKDKIKDERELTISHTFYINGSPDPAALNPLIENYLNRDHCSDEEAAGLKSDQEVRASLVKILKENLGLEKLNENSNYFKLGGNSLSATKLVVEINKHFNCQIKLNDIFENADFSQLLQLVTDKWKNSDYTEGEI